MTKKAMRSCYASWRGRRVIQRVQSTQRIWYRGSMGNTFYWQASWLALYALAISMNYTRDSYQASVDGQAMGDPSSSLFGELGSLDIEAEVSHTVPFRAQTQSCPASNHYHFRKKITRQEEVVKKKSLLFSREVQQVKKKKLADHTNIVFYYTHLLHFQRRSNEGREKTYKPSFYSFSDYSICLRQASPIRLK